MPSLELKLWKNILKLAFGVGCIDVSHILPMPGQVSAITGEPLTVPGQAKIEDYIFTVITCLCIRNYNNCCGQYLQTQL